MWNIPNILSIFRLLLSIPMGFALWHNEIVIAVMLGFLSSITDNLDGYYARRFNQITEFGKVIDPLSDKIFVGVTVIILLIQGKMPIWFAALIWGRDILLLLGGLYTTKKLGLVVSSNIIGKATITVVGFTLMFIIIGYETLIFYGLILSTIFMTLSFVLYLFSALKKIKEVKRTNSEE